MLSGMGVSGLLERPDDALYPVWINKNPAVLFRQTYCIPYKNDLYVRAACVSESCGHVFAG